MTGAWKPISKQRRQVDVSYDPSMVTALRHGIIHGWIERDYKKTCIKKKGKKEGIHQPFNGK